jgi:hypothetical protein
MPHLTFDTGMEKREYPFRDRTSHSLDISEKIRVESMEEVVSLPESAAGEGPGASFRGGYRSDPTTIAFYLNAEYPKRVYQASDWNSFRDAVIYQNKLSETPVIVRIK